VNNAREGSEGGVSSGESIGGLSDAFSSGGRSGFAAYLKSTQKHHPFEYPLGDLFPPDVATAIVLQARQQGTSESAVAVSFLAGLGVSSGLSIVRGLGGIGTRLVNQHVISGVTGVGKSAPLQETSNQVNHNRGLLITAATQWEQKSNDKTGTTEDNHGIVVSLSRVGCAVRCDTLQALFDVLCNYTTDASGNKKLKTRAQRTEQVLQVNDEAADYTSMQEG
jgi:hypothetical protein